MSLSGNAVTSGISALEVDLAIVAVGVHNCLHALHAYHRTQRAAHVGLVVRPSKTDRVHQRFLCFLEGGGGGGRSGWHVNREAARWPRTSQVTS